MESTPTTFLKAWLAHSPHERWTTPSSPLHQRLFQWLSLQGATGQCQVVVIPGGLGIFVDLTLGPMLIIMALMCTWSFLHTPRPSRGSCKLWITCSSKQITESQSQEVSYIGLHQSSTQEAQEKYTQWQALDNIRAGSNKLHKWHIQREILAGTKPCCGEFYFMWPVSAQ